jgi:hypothetical protein
MANLNSESLFPDGNFALNDLLSLAFLSDVFGFLVSPHFDVALT